MVNATIEKLQKMLDAEEESRQKLETIRDSRRASVAPLRRQVRRVLQEHGVVSPSTESRARPIPSSLFCCPLTAPQTTLRYWSSLPQSIRLRLTPPDENDDPDAVVEVPLSLLAEDTNHSQGVHSLQSRPLGGNLTNKLTEYTRGVSGQCKPFRPGGLDVEDVPKALQQQKEVASESPREILLAKQVLEKGSRDSWTDGTILTSPPGADFDVGIGWEDVYQNQESIPKGVNAMVESASSDEPSAHNEEPSQREPHTRVREDAGSVWERNFFDDDSLFGESSSESSGDSDESTHESEEPLPQNKSTREHASQHKQPATGVVDRNQSTHDDDGGVVATHIDELDYLLSELSISERGEQSKQPRVASQCNNPLYLAELHAKEQRQSSRKTWADTKPLPIKDFHALIPNPAMAFPFTLDGFQQQAVARLERSESIFVAAHTSAGKTVCAEYAIAMCKQHCTRLVYTSPIKALSNQKFRDFCTKFGAENVGLVTGDLQVNVDDSTVLICTTEILRSMLYRGADIIRDIEWVCFDEVHYVNDTERGVVWEEVIIMLPPYVNLIFLSATTPNTIEFSDWIGRTKRKPVHVIRTDYRPVPLSHYLWAGLKLHKIMEGKGGFVERGYSEAFKALLPTSAKDTGNKKGSSAKPNVSTPSSRYATGSKQMTWQAQGNKQNWTALVKFLDREGLTPSVVFSFSKKKCEEIAKMLRTLDLNTAAEKGAAQAFALQTVARLSPNDSILPQVLTVSEMVSRGIGVHHGGLLPILKEMVEILFSRNLIKVLFATETFAMGVNMPARAVVFNSIGKHDGTQFRVLEPGEYTQMAGRAGRRGLDKVGTVITCCFGDTPPPQPLLRTMLTGSSTKLQSQFRLTYNMILNLLRVEDMSVEDMIKRSFSEFATQRALTANDYPKLLARGTRTLSKLEREFSESSDSRIGAEDIEAYYNLSSDLLSTNASLLTDAIRFGNSPLVSGRILLVTAARKNGYVRAPALVLRPPLLSGGINNGSRLNAATGPQSMVCFVLLPESFVYEAQADCQSSDDSSMKQMSINYVGSSRSRHFAIHEIKLDDIHLVTAIKHKIDAKLLLKSDADSKTGNFAKSNRIGAFAGVPSAGRRGTDDFVGMVPRGRKGSSDKSDFSKSSRQSQVVDEAVGALIEAEKMESASTIEALDLRETVKQGVDVIEFRNRCSRVEELIRLVRSSPSHRHPSVERHYATVERIETLRKRVTTLQHILSNESLQLFPDFLQRKSLLRSLGYVDDNETVCVKGRVACEVNTCEELIVTEMIFEGVLNELESAEIVAALSSLVFQEKNSDEDFDSELPERLTLCCNRMKTIATNLGKIQKDHGLEIDPEEYCENSLKFGLVHVVYEWAIGVPFSNICQLTLVQEGSIVRCITRLDELCREVRNCARVVGNPTLYRKMESASVAIKRDIVFASSLYVS